MLAPDKESGGVRPTSAAGLYYPKEAEGLRCALRTCWAARASPRVGCRKRWSCRTRVTRIPVQSPLRHSGRWRTRLRPRSATWCCWVRAIASRCAAWPCPRATSSRRRSAQVPHQRRRPPAPARTRARGHRGRTARARAFARGAAAFPAVGADGLRPAADCGRAWRRPSRWVARSRPSGAARKR